MKEKIKRKEKYLKVFLYNRKWKCLVHFVYLDREQKQKTKKSESCVIYKNKKMMRQVKR